MEINTEQAKKTHKLLIAAVLFTFTSSLCKAQYISAYTPVYKTVSKDTINIKGRLFDAFGTPVRGFQIMSRNKEYVYDGYYNYALTDSAGNFTLNGALSNDTLSIGWDNQTVKVNANGSRYIEIRLPPRTADTAYKIPIDISAKRINKKKRTPVFKVITNAPISDYYGVLPNMYIPARAMGTTFRDYVSSKLIYPVKAVENNIEGEVQISFVIERDGRLTSFHVTRGIGYGCEDAVISVLKNHNWRPAVAAGKPVVSSSFVIIDFKLTGQ